MSGAKAAVVYSSRYGHAERYARWIAEELGADLYDARRADWAALAGYGAVVYGGGLYAGGVRGAKLLNKHLPALEGCDLIVFTVGAADPAVTDYTPILERNFPDGVRAKLRFFHLRGGIDYPRLNPAHRVMMRMMAAAVRGKPEEEKTPEDRMLLATYGQVVDFCDRAAVRPLVEAVRAAVKTKEL